MKTLLNARFASTAILLLLAAGCAGKSAKLLFTDSEPTKKGDECVYKGDYQCALDAYDEAIKLEPNYSNLYNNRGVAHYLKGEREAAKSDFERALDTEGVNTPAWSNLGWAELTLGDPDRAEECFSTALLNNQVYMSAMIGRGAALIAAGDVDKAMDELDVAVKMDPKSAAARVWRAEAWIASGGREGALADLDRAQSLAAGAAPCRVQYYYYTSGAQEGMLESSRAAPFPETYVVERGGEYYLVTVRPPDVAYLDYLWSFDLCPEMPDLASARQRALALP